MVNNANFRPADKYAIRVTKNIITTQGTLCKSNCAPFMGQLKTQDMFKKNQPNLLTNFSIKKFIQSEIGTISSLGYFVDQLHSSLNIKKIVVIRIIAIQLKVFFSRITNLIRFPFFN
jgi:hypothetical protein